MSSSNSSIPQVQLPQDPQEQSYECSDHSIAATASITSTLTFASCSNAGQAVQRQGSSPIKVQTKGRFTIIEEEGSSPKLSFKLPSFGGSLSSQKSAAGAAAGSSSTNASPGTAAYKAASTPGTTKAARNEASSGHCQLPISSKKPAAGALQMPGT